MDDQVIVSHADSLSHAEIETQLQDGPGVLIVRGAYQDNSLLDVVADHFYKRIQVFFFCRILKEPSILREFKFLFMLDSLRSCLSSRR